MEVRFPLVSRSLTATDCFYRGFAFAYCERLLPENGSGGGAAATRALAQIDGLLPLLDRVGFSKSMYVPTRVASLTLSSYEDFLEPFRSLLAKFTSSTPPSSAELLEAFQDAGESHGARFWSDSRAQRRQTRSWYSCDCSLRPTCRPTPTISTRSSTRSRTTLASSKACPRWSSSGASMSRP